MYYKVEYDVYESKLATFVSMLQSSIWICFAVFFPIFNIPSFICLICDVDAVVIGMLFGILGVLSLVVSILFCIFVDASKIDDYMLRKKKKSKEQQEKESLSDLARTMKTRDYLYNFYLIHGVELDEVYLLEIVNAVMKADSNEEKLSIMFSNIPANSPTVEKFILYTTLFIEKYIKLFCPDDDVKQLLNKAIDEVKSYDVLAVNIAYNRQKTGNTDGDLFRFNYELIAVAIVFNTLEENKHLCPASCERMLKSMRFYVNKAGYTKVS